MFAEERSVTRPEHGGMPHRVKLFEHPDDDAVGIRLLIALDFLRREQTRAWHVTLPMNHRRRSVARNFPARPRPRRDKKDCMPEDFCIILMTGKEIQRKGKDGTSNHGSRKGAAICR